MHYVRYIVPLLVALGKDHLSGVLGSCKRWIVKDVAGGTTFIAFFQLPLASSDL